MSFRERMRSKQREVKVQYSFLGAFVVTGIIATLWALSLPARFADIATVKSVEGPTEEMSGKEDTTDGAHIFDSARDQLGSIISRLAPKDTEVATDTEQNVEDVQVARENYWEEVTPTSSPVREVSDTHDSQVSEETAATTSSSGRTVLIATTTDKMSE